MINSPLIHIDQVSFSYGENPAINNISTTLHEGRFYGIVGPNGCGKTTLLDLITGSKKCQQGTILLENRELSEYSRKELARKMALVPQEYDTSFGYTVEEIVLMGRHPHIDRFAAPNSLDWEAVDSALDMIGIADLRERYTNTLSGGQKQRAVVARALAQDSTIILFDEATSNLDIRFTLQIFNIAKSLVINERRTVIAVIHDLNFAAAYCDEILLMDEGKLVVHRATEEALTASYIKEVFGVHCVVDLNQHNNSLQISYEY